MRIITRPDFDGIVCAVLLRKAEDIDHDILWAEPSEIQRGKIKISKNDIMANLPYSSECGLWFDHHISNKPENNFKGAFEIAPSAAGVIYKHYKKAGKFDDYYDALIENTDMIDAADLNIDQVRHPENYPYILLSMTIKNHEYKDIAYWNKLVDLLTEKDINNVIVDKEVEMRCHKTVQANKAFENHLLAHTKVISKISITDFRPLEIVPDGNRFLTYSLFPETIASIKLRFDNSKKKNIQLSIGRSIFQTKCNVNIGRLLARFGGGGHAGAGGCTLETSTANKILEEIFEIMFENKKEH